MTTDKAATVIELAVEDEARLHKLRIMVGSFEREALLGRTQRYRDDIERWG